MTIRSSRPAAGPVAADRTVAGVLAEAADARATIVLSGHVQPDADALGSTLSLAEGLRRRGARVLTTFPDPFTLPASLGWLPGAEGLVPSSSVPSSPDVFVSLDAASPGRLGELAVLLDRAGTSVVVDHHASNPGFGDVRLIDGLAPATVTLVAGLLDELGVSIDPQLATCLYAGLAADTGSFRFGNTRPETHELAARLLATGIPVGEISRRLFDSRPFGAVRLFGEAMGRARLEPDGVGFVWTYATLDDLHRFQQRPAVLEALIDAVRCVEEADVSCVVKQVAEREWTVSLRSKGAVDVSAIAVALGGGGHKFAAGFTGRGSVDDVVAAIRGRLPRPAR